MEKKFLKISIIAIMIILVFSTVVNALSFTATMTPSSTTVAESTEFTIAIKVSNLDVGTNGINSLSGYLKYDTSAFEVISDSSIEGLNSWSPTFNSDSGKITLTKTTFVKAEESVFQVTFKTKTDVSGQSGAISFTNIVASNSEKDISASDISTSITIGTATGNTTNTTNTTNTNTTIPIITNITNNTNTTGNATNIVTNNTVSSYVNTTNSVPSEDIPYTGVEDTIKYVIIVLMAITIGFYIKFEKINKELK